MIRRRKVAQSTIRWTPAQLAALRAVAAAAGVTPSEYVRAAVFERMGLSLPLWGDDKPLPR